MDTDNADKQGFEHVLIMPYTTGFNLAVNAIPDAYAVVDAPNCMFFKTSQIQGNHDWSARLVSSDGLHRVADTDCTTERAAAGDERLLVTRLLQVNAIEDCAFILLTAMSPAAVTGRQYDKIVRDLGDRLSRPVVLVRSGSLTGDWLHGYIWTLEDLAAQIPLDEKAGLDPDQVALVGYLWDRNEQDHHANLAELRRLLAGMNLELVSCWLSGGGLSELLAAAAAGTLVSLPYGRVAAQTLARRTGARVVECGLPLGLAGTSAWLRQVGVATGRATEAEEVVEKELRAAVPRLEWILPHGFLNKGVAVLGSDPYLLEALSAAVAEFGCSVPLKGYVAHGDHLEAAGVEPGEDTLVFNRDPEELVGSMNRLIENEALHLAIANSRLQPLVANLGRHLPLVELGFPSYYTHAIFDRPFLGYRGALKLVESMANAMSHAALIENRLRK